MNNMNNNFDENAAELRTRSNWTELKGKMRQTYGNLTDDYLEYTEGKQEEWFGKIGNKIGKTAQDVKSWIKGL